MLSIFNRDSNKQKDAARDQKDFWWWEESVTPIKTKRISGAGDDIEIFRDYQRKTSLRRA